MNRALLHVEPWRLVVLIAAAVPFAVWGERVWGATSGSLTLAVFLVPVVVVSLSGRLGWSLAAASLVSGGICWEALRSEGPQAAGGQVLAIVTTACLVSMAVVVATTVRHLQQQLHRHRQQLKDSSDEWIELKPTVVEEPDAALLAAARTPEQTREEDRIDFPLLLLTLQDIGRRVSMNLDLDSLIPAILSTAKSSLDCTHCEVYLWDHTRRELVNPLPARSRDAQTCTPSAHTGIGEWVLRERRILTRNDLDRDAEMAAAAATESHVPEAVAPLIVGSDVLGLIVVDRLRSRSHNFLQMLYTLANIYALGIKNAQLFRRIEEMALHDGLTGLYNHVTFQRKLRGLMREALINESPFCLVMSDLDHFKQINDTCGHLAGDEVLRETARLWKAALPSEAIVARYGGEEFIAVIPDAGVQKGTELAEFLRESIADHPFLHEGHALQVTASFGVAEFVGADQSIDDVVREADQNLYAAKRAGRNRTVSRPRSPILGLRRPG